MSLDATNEQGLILQHLRDECTQAVYDAVPDEQILERDVTGIYVNPYVVCTFGGLFPRQGDRSIEGPEQQPQIMPIIAECWGGTMSEARALAGQVRVALVGWAGNDNMDPIDLRGGSWFVQKDNLGKPTRYVETVTATTTVNNSVEV